MRARLKSFLYFLLAVTAVLVVLKTLNWLPQVVQKDTMRRYGSLDDVRTKLGIRDLAVPSYYPQSIAWPPSQILAQSKPYPAVIMICSRAGSGEDMIAITQAASDRFDPGNVIRLARVKERVPYRLKGRDAVLEVGTCASEEICSRIEWQQGEYRMTVAMKSSPFELIKIAESMIR